MSCDVSVIVCTHNRVQSVVKAVQSLVDQTLPGSSYEIIVVDNASTDGTGEVLSGMFASRPQCFVVAEPRLGLSRARNTGLRASSGSKVAFLDDDAEAYPDWLERMLAAFGLSGAAAVGGIIEPVWENQRPSWLPARADAFLTILDLGDTPRQLSKGEYLFGTNLAFDRQKLQSIGGFHTQLGRVGASLMGDEDTLAQILLRNKGEAIYYDPSIRVRHHVHPERLDPSWILKRYYWQGKSMVGLAGVRAGFTMRHRIAVPLMAMARCGKALVMLSPGMLLLRRRSWVDLCCHVSELFGVLSASLKPRPPLPHSE